LRSCRARKNGQECKCDRPRENAGHCRPCQQTQTTDCADGLESETARPVLLSSAINPHDCLLTGNRNQELPKGTCIECRCLARELIGRNPDLRG
jgi:hypothetical protein